MRKDKIPNSGFLLQKGAKKETWERGKRGGDVVAKHGGFLERERLTVSERSDCRQSSGLEGELLYAERASFGYQI